MDTSDRGSLLIPKFSTSDAGESDENDQNYDKTAPERKNPTKKPPMKKHFMSPTVSAASKAQAPRNKILAERNQISCFSYTRPHKTQHPDSRTCSGSDNDEETNTCVSDSSSKPYDPLRNYLSPRPKFLRYKPKRRRVIFTSQENDGSGVETSVSFDSPREIVRADSYSILSLRESLKKPEDEGIKTRENDRDDDADEDIDEFEMEICLSLEDVLKFLLVCVTLFLSTLYICSMNSPIHSPTLKSIWVSKDGYFKFHNHTFEVETLNIFEGRTGSSVQRDWTHLASGNVFEEEVMVEDNNNKGLVELDEMKNGQSEDVCDDQLDEEEEGSIGLEVEETVESEDVNDHSLEKTEEGFDQLRGIETVEIEEKAETFQDYQIPRVSDHLDHHGQVEVEEKIETSEVISLEVEGLDDEHTEASTAISQGEVNSIELISGKVIGFLVFFGLSLLGMRWRHKITTVKNLSTKNPVPESLLAEKISLEIPVIHNVEEEKFKKVESFANPSSLIRSTEGASKDFYQIRATTVEFLGEFVVGEFSNSFMKSCNMKSKKTMMETEMSNNSFFKENGKHIKADVISSQVNSPSYGSFTAEKKIVKKEEGKDGEARTAVTSPVRQSSRIRKRAVMSP